MPMLEESAPVRFAQRASSSSPGKSMSKQVDAKAVRGEQLRDLLNTLGMTRKSFSSSSSGSKGNCHDGDLASEAAMAQLLTDGLRTIDSETSTARRTTDHAVAKPVAMNADTSIRDARIKQLEDEYVAQMVELRLEVQKARKTEQRLRIDRDEWRLMAENMQPMEGEDNKEDNNGDEMEENPDEEGKQPAESPPNPDDGDDGDSPPRKRGKKPNSPGGGAS